MERTTNLIDKFGNIIIVKRSKFDQIKQLRIHYEP